MDIGSRWLAVIFGACTASAAFGQTALAQCKEKEYAVITVSGTIRQMVAEEHDGVERQLAVERSDNDACGVDTIWLDELKLPAECTIGTTVTATGKLTFGDFGDKEYLEEVQSLSCK